MSRRVAASSIRAVREDRECPYCGGTMRVKARQSADRIPATPEVVSTQILEWICPDCDYFEEFDRETGTRDSGSGS